MTGKARMELAVGFFVVMGIVALTILALKVSNLSSFGSGDGYNISVKFENIGGLKVRAPVMMAGVRIGEVSKIDLDTKLFEAQVILKIDTRYNNLPKDTSASIFTSGLLGEQYVALEPGGEMKVLAEGDSLSISQPAVVLEQILGQFLFSKAEGND
ncbi:MAG: outer membrane lipid asymmetry maintenance protein MlaD [Gammaproteobacteria bacterium]|nr:outer membrane lipid asymmetry maintenance protein MlaD [Gammaproteobacteria bacterium]